MGAWVMETNAEGIATPRYEHYPKTATGLPNYNDTVGRFLARMRGADKSFGTDGREITSYRWYRLAYWGADGRVYYDDKMWDSPYSGETSGHIAEMLRGFRGAGVVVANAGRVPEEKVSGLAAQVALAAMRAENMTDFRRGLSFSWHMGIAAYPWERIFRMAKARIREDHRRDRSKENLATLRARYTAESVREWNAWHRDTLDKRLALVDAYRERFLNESYSTKFPPVPNRFPKEPSLVRKENAPRTERRAILAWHFLHEPRLGYGDGREVVVGETLSVDRKIIQLCQGGLHGSERLGDAHGYVHGSYLCRVLLWGAVDVGIDKVAAEHRRVLGMLRVDDALRLAIRMDRASGTTNAEAMTLERMGLTAEGRTPATAATTT